MMRNKVYIIFVVFLSLIGFSSEAQKHIDESSQTITKITSDGAWCWFSDPRAIYVHSSMPGILTGWVTSNGSIESAKIDWSGNVKKQVLASKIDKDDHANPSFVELNNGGAAVFYVIHFDKFVRVHLMGKDETQFGEAIHNDPFDEQELKKFPLRRTSYANPYVLSKENGKVYCFGRWTGFKPNMMVSTDNGKTFSKSKVLITNYPFDSNNRPYAKYFSDGKSKIHIVFTDGHPRNEPNNSVYYACYEKGAFWKADGTKICSVDELPFEPKDATLVYKADKENGKSWIYDIAADKKGNPVILFAKYPDDLNHIYFYSHFDGKKWIESKICNSGKWFPQTIAGKTEREPNYSAGMTVNPLNTNEVYVSEQIDGVFEIVKYKFNKRGKITFREEITKHSKFDNVRPFIPRNMQKGDSKVVLWMQNERYIHYTDFKTSIMMLKEN